MIRRSGGRGRSWVPTVGDERTVVGYCLADVVDNNAHLEQISTLPQWPGHAVARQLLGVLRAWSTSPTTRMCLRLTL